MVGSIVVPFAAVGEATQERDGSDENLDVASIENQTVTDENGHMGDASTDWPRFGGDDFNTGSTSAAGPVTDVGEAWSFPTVGPIQSSPAVVDDVVFFGSHDGHVYALDVEGGEELWRFDTGAKITSSPTVVDGVVYIGTQESDGDNVFAIDAEQGTEQWAVEIGENAEVEFSSPAVDNVRLYIGASHHSEDNFYALDTTDGSVEWSVELKGSGVLSSPVVVDGTVYVGSEWGDHDYNVWAVDAVTGDKVPLVGAYGRAESSPAVVDNVLYIGTYVSGADAHAFDLESGETAWSFDTGDVVKSSPAVDDGVVYVGNAAQWSSDAHIYALNASPEWDGGTYENEDEKWRYSTDGGVLSSPAVADGVVYVGSQGGTVHAIDSDGSGVWDFETAGSVRSSPAVVDGTVYVGSDDGRLYAIRESPGVIATGDIDVTEPLTVESEEITIDVSLENTGANQGYAIVRNAATGEGTTLTLEGSGTYTVSTDALGGVDTGDDVQLKLYENETRENRLAATQVTVLAPQATGTIELEEPVLPGSEFKVTYSFENTHMDRGWIQVRKLDGGSVVESVYEDGSMSIKPESVDGVQEGDIIEAELYDELDFEPLSESTATVEGDVTYVDECTVIRTPGDYALTDDLIGDGDDCIRITASDVTFDGQGHTITGGEGSEFSTRGISVENADRVTVTDVTTSGWGTGVFAEDAADVSVRNVEAEYNTFGIRIQNVDRFALENARAAENVRAGVQVYDSHSGLVRNVTAADNAVADGWTGIYVRDGSTNIELDDVHAKGSLADGNGITITSDTADVSVTNATAIGNDGTGLLIEADDVEVSNVEVRENGWDLVADAVAVAADNLTIGSSTASNTTLSLEAEYIRLRANSSPPANPAAESIGRYFDVEAIGNGTLDVSVHYEQTDVTDVNEETLRVWWFDGSDWAVTEGTTVDTDANTVDVSLTEFSTFGVFGEVSAGDPDPGPSPSPDPTTFDVILENTTSPVTAGEEVEVNATIENTGEEDGTQTIELVADGTVVDAVDATLDEGETKTVTLTWATDADDADEAIPLEVRSDDDEDATEVTVEEVDQDAHILLYGADADREHLSIGETVTVSGDLYNGGDVAGIETVALEVDGEVVDEATVTVAPGIDRGGVELTWTPALEDLPDGEDEMDVTLALDGFFVDTVTVGNQYSDINVIAAGVSEVEAVEGEELYVTGSIYQAGTIEGPEEIELTATNTETNESEVVGTQEVSLEPGFYYLGALNITFELEPGTYDLELGDRHAGPVEVEPAESDIQVIAASASEIELVEGEELHVIGSIYQAGNIEGTEEIELTATNTETNETEVVGTQEVTLAPGFYHLGALNVTYVPDEAGTYDLELGDRHAGTVEVEAAGSDINVIAAGVSEVEAVEGDELYVTGSIYQAGNIAGPEEIELTATNTETNETEVVGTQEASLEPGYYHLGALNVSFTAEPGTYDLELGERAAGTIEVEPAESDVTVIAASVSDVEAVEGEELHVVGSIYQAGNIEGTEEIELTATNTETNETEVLGSQEVTLAPGFYHLGALNVTFEPEPGTYDLELGDRHAGTIEVEPAESDITVIAASASEVELIEGEELHVIGSVYQAGNIAGTEEIELTATHNETGETEVVGTQELTVAPNVYHLGALNISFTPDEPGHYDLELGGTNAGWVEVEEAVSDVQVIAASASDVEIAENEETYVIGSVYQAGNVEGTEEIELTATHEDGTETVVGSQEVTVAPNVYHLGALNVTFEPEQTGNYTLELGGVNAGTVYVEEIVTDIQVIAAATSDVELIEGEETYVIGSVYQNGSDTATEEIELTATNQETSETHVVGSQEVTVAPGTYHLGALNVTFTPDEPGTYDLELGDRNAGWVEVEPAVSDIQVVAASSSEVELIEGEEMHVIGSVYQAGNVAGTEEIELTATHNETGETEVIGTQELTVAPNAYHLGALNVSFTPDEPGHYDLQLGGTNAGWVEVEPAESDINVIAAATSEVELVEGEELHVIGSVYQAGTIEGTEEIELTATNTDTGESTVVGTQDVTVAPNVYHLGAINVTYAPDEAGTYELELGDRYAGTVEVEPAESDINVIAAGVSEIEAVEGDELYVIGSIYQAGTIEGPEEIELTATNTETGETEVLGSQEVTLEPGFYHLGALNVSFTPDQAGTYDLEFGDRYAGTVEVQAAESDINVIAAGVSDVEAAEGEELYVIGSIYQAGTIDGPQVIELTATNVETGETDVVGSQEVTLEPGFYHLGALNVSFTPDEAGTYELELGDRYASTIEVVEPTVEPTVVAVEGYSSGVDPETGADLEYASDDATVEIDVEADLEVEEVTLLVSSHQASYAVSVDATHQGGERWHAAVPLETISDDGRYALSVVAVDERDNAGMTDAAETLVIDRDEPSMAVSIEDVDGDDATVVVESDDPLAGAPEVSATFTDPEDGSTAPVDVVVSPVDGNDTAFTGTLEFDESGNYTVTAVGTDRAGNEGTDTASAVINTDFTLHDGEIVIDQSGTSIAFEIADDADEAIKAEELFLALSENTVNPNVDDGDLGVGFITADLDGFLDHHLEQGTIEGATVSLAADDSSLPGGASLADAQIHHYDQSADQWDPVETDLEVVDGDPFLTSRVTHFSTYGALIADEESPQLVDVETLEGDDNVTVRFEYEDAMSGVNVSAVSLSLDGTDVTGESQITSSVAEYTVDGDAGSSHTVDVVVVDNAGNVGTFETNVTVPGPDASDGTDPDDGSDADDGDDSERDDTVPGFGVMLTLIVLLTIALVTVRLRL